jgi:4-hydroxy-tetrahydrodipicolinate reductase
MSIGLNTLWEALKRGVWSRISSVRSMSEIRAIQLGLGALGVELARFGLRKEGLQIVGAADPVHAGKDLSKVVGLDRDVGVTVATDLAALLESADADVLIHATSSYLKETYSQIMDAVEAGLNVVSTCEELSYPFFKYPELSNRLDAAAKKHGVTVLGTGINPGFLMDTLPIVLSSVCTNIRKIKVTRVMYSGNRRSSFQKKIGTGLTPEEFQGLMSEGKITGHVGLIESVAMLSSTIGLQVDEIRELPPEPVLCTQEVRTAFATVKPGQVAGLRSTAVGIKAGKEVLTLEFLSHANVERPCDSVEIDGDPMVKQRIDGGVHGDAGTVAMVFNAIPKVLNAPPGLATMATLPLASACLGDYRKYINWRALKGSYI